MKKLLWVMVALCACMGLTVGASAAPLLLDENFDWGDGQLLTAHGWTAHSGTGTQAIDVWSPGLAYAGYPTSSVVGQAARLDNNGEDDNHAITSTSTGTIYCAFLVSVVSPTAGYFAMLNQSATIFAARVSVAPSGSGMTLGISNTSTAPTGTPTYALNTTHLVVVKFDFTSQLAYMWVNPSLAPCAEPTADQTSATAATGFIANGVALRQYNLAQNINIDGIRVGTTWADVVCGVASLGACCAPDGNCSQQTQADCVAAGNSYLGDGLPCSPNPCPQLGTCCALDGTCTFVLQANCAGAWTEGGACSPNPCTQPVGSCCAVDGTCAVTTQANCATVWTEGGVCVPNTCAQPSGSCCYPDGTCAVTLLADCTGAWTMFGVCVPNTCAQPTGACCLSTGLCTVGTAADCQTVGGLYQGNFTLCSPNPCPAQPKTVCDVAADDLNGVALLVGQRVTVQGIALCSGLTWSATIREFQITDGNCCIDVFGGTLTPSVALGDLVQVTGTVANYNGKTELTTPDLTVTVLSSGNPVPAPGVTTTGTLATAGEPFESCLFTMHCVSMVGGTWPTTFADANITIDDGTGPVVMRLDKDTNCWTVPAPTGPFTVTGIGDQYDTTSPYTSGWQIKPRFPADLVMTGCATGACCFPNGNCLVVNEAACASQNGTYQGDNSTCTPNNCPPPIGACCTPDGVCTMLPEAQCTGLWLTYGSVCTPNPCEQPNGSCCYPDGTCMVMVQAACTGGTWTMLGVCVPNTCQQPLGACCNPDGTCSIQTQAACIWTWIMGGVCTPNPCPQPPATGACCIGTTCVVATQIACAGASGVYKGDGVPCSPDLCTGTPTDVKSWGQIKTIFR